MKWNVLSTQNIKLKTASMTDPAHTSCPCRAEVNFYPQGVRVCRYELFSHTGKETCLLSVLSGLLERPKGAGERKKAVMNCMD
jgi:hypothetical protein